LSFFPPFRRPPASDRTTAEGGPRGSGWRRVGARVLTTLAVVLVFFALIAPNQLSKLEFSAFVRIPIEGLVGLALLLVLRGRARRVVAVPAGVALGLLTIVKIVDMGFFWVLSRPFDLVLDWILFGDGFDALAASIGTAGAVGVAIGAVLLAAAVLVLMTLAVQRLTRLAGQHRTAAARTAGVLAAAWVACALLGAQLAPGLPIAASSASHLVYDRAVQVRDGVRDQQRFAAQAAVDTFHGTPGDQMLTALRGKDVVITVVESYGRTALENPAIAPQVNPVLDDGNRRLNAAGYSARSGFLTSPVSGSGSWLAHATFLSGLWINNQQRYRTLVSSDRLTLTSAFQRADWRTVSVEAGTDRAWPEGKFYGFDKVYDSRDLGYRGPKFSWSPMPDQYILSTFQRSEYGTPGRGPLMAEIPLVSSHWPWAPLPKMVDWNQVGDGSVYDAIAKQGDSPEEVWKDTGRVRAEYGRSVAYSLESLVSYVEKYGNDNLVLVFFGDHQPSPTVTGGTANRDVPITIVAHDKSVLDRISGWGWQEGLKPNSQAPVWKMDAFRDKFLTAFGSQSAPRGSASRPTR
jgi:hypothetical protein